MISQTLKKWESFDFSAFFENVAIGDIYGVLNKPVLTGEDLLILLSPKAQECLEEIAARAGEISLHQFGRVVNLYTPLYISNYCDNNCLYCGFSKEQNIKRKQLPLEEIEKEAQVISISGFSHILLLTGGDREKAEPSYILEAVKILKRYFASISIEIYALTEDEYSSFLREGVDHVVLYQETYNRNLYGKLHREGEKSDYSFRLDAPERAAAAGAYSVNMGVLLGLDDPRIDFFKAALHSDDLRRKYPGTSIAMSFPRIRPAAGGFQPKWEVSNPLLVQLITAYRIFQPRAEISISTRESAQLRNNLLPLGVTKMSAGSITAVGTRSGDEGSEQFSISDTRSLSEMDTYLKKVGYQPVYKDWVSV